MKLSCHCKNITIEVETPTQVTECNCSICSRYVSLWGYYEPDQPDIHIGEAGFSSYSWGDRELEFIRCAACGCVTHYQTVPGLEDPRVAVNFGMARSEVGDVPIRYFDGANEL